MKLFAASLKKVGALAASHFDCYKQVWRAGLLAPRLAEIPDMMSSEFTYKARTKHTRPKQVLSESTLQKYAKTLLLPESEFPKFIPAESRKDHELSIMATTEFDQLYRRQRLWRKDHEEYILHDGPPYANGEAHIGHAVNKVLKDVTNRYRLLKGHRINYVPGFDCHGLPIELKTLKKRSGSQSPEQIRIASREVADKYIVKQSDAFRRWGVMADWGNSYKTYDGNYIKEELRMFLELYEKNLIYQGLKPVFWSPSTQTALAEAELEYRANHESTSVYLAVDVGMKLLDFASKLGLMLPEGQAASQQGQVMAAIWTTTPWTIPANAAIAFNENENYSIVHKDCSRPEDCQYLIVASALVPKFGATIGANLRVLTEFPGKNFENVNYKHPWFKEVRCPFLPGTFVTTEKGTGLVHVAPAHGQDDYKLALSHNLAFECYVDNNGNFDARLLGLSGLPAMSGGTKALIEKLSNEILLEEKVLHPYPYDWRSKKPVLVKTSTQWFINTEAVKNEAATQLKDVNFYPLNVQNGMLNQLMRRPYWCVSRQRVWGVPIPVIYNKETKEPLVEKAIVDRLCELVNKKGTIDFWWTLPVAELLPHLKDPELYEKGQDIFDIWFDSGVSWHTLRGKQADLCLEGQDQFTGWFQASLLTSSALRTKAPYKNLFVHGFVVDDKNKKMSKSIGNVVNPYDITDGNLDTKRPAFGADAMRWWIATQGSCDGSSILYSNSFLRSAEVSIQKLRHTLRFLLCYVDEVSCDDMDLDDVLYDELEYMDQYMLGLTLKFRKQVTENYEKFEYHKVMARTLQFVSTEVSGLYIPWIKDRLYSDQEDSQSRKSALFVMNHLFLTLIKTLGPVLPFLTEESYSYYSAVPESLFKYTWFDLKDQSWENDTVQEIFDLVLSVRTSLYQIIGNNDSAKVWVEIICNQKNFKLLQMLHPDRCNSELCDILQVSGVDLVCQDKAQFTITPYGVSHTQYGFSVGVSQTNLERCVRCRRYSCEPLNGGCLCLRCVSVLKSKQVKAKQIELELQNEEREGLLPEESPTTKFKSDETH